MKKIIIYLLIVFGSVMGVLIYSRFVATTGLVTKEIVIKSNNLPESYEGLKIVHFSDLLYSKNTDWESINKVVEEINLINPDIVVFTGDLLVKGFDISKDELNDLGELLKSIKCKYGKYAIIGDNDLEKIATLRDTYLKGDFVLLENGYDVIYNDKQEEIFIGGVTSIWEGEGSIERIMNYFEGNSDLNYKIILVHEPDYVEEILKKYTNIDLILAGHTLNGQVNIPYVKNLLLPENGKKYYEPYYKIGNTEVFISGGLGVSITNFRLFNRPSLNFYRVMNDE